MMRGAHWTQVGLTAALLLSEVVIGQLCKSPITLLDGFHTLFILLNILYLSLTKSLIGGHLSSVDPQKSPTKMSPASQTCGVAYRDMRAQPVGAFVSSLGLLSLNIIYLTEISSFMLDPSPVRRPLLLVVMGAVSLLYKLFLLGLHWNQLQSLKGSTEMATESHIEVNHTALAEETKGRGEQGGVLNNYEQNGLNVDSSLHDTALTISNPNTLILLEDTKEHHTNGTCGQRSDTQNPPSITSASPKLPVIHQVPYSLRSSWLHIFEHLLTPLLVLVNGLVTLSISPVCLHNSRLCGLMVYVDPVLSLLAVVILSAKAIPEVFRYGLLLLQCTPPHLSVAELGKMIMDVPGVEAMHELHVWKLTDSFIVASVHVHCQTSLQIRCLDVMLGVTKVLQSVGVSCCTIQPEFVCQEIPSQRCSLACGQACAGSMCCSQLEEQYRTLAAKSTEKTKEEPLVIPNTVH